MVFLLELGMSSLMDKSTNGIAQTEQNINQINAADNKRRNVLYLQIEQIAAENVRR